MPPGPTRRYGRKVRRPPRSDVALALAVAVLGQVDVLAPHLFPTHLSGPHWAVSVGYLVASLALAWRRTRPGVAFLVVAVVLSLQALAWGASSGNGSLVPALVVSYSVAAHGSRRDALAAAAALPLLVVVREVSNPLNATWHDTFHALGWDLLLPAAWLLGAYLRTRRLYVDELHARALRAEQEREERARLAVAEERARIARELHDVVAHAVSVMVVQAEAADELVTRDRAADAVRPLRSIQATGREALGELRRLLGVLRADDAALEPQSGLADVDALLDGVRAAGIDVTLRRTGSAESLGAGLGLAGYRIVQEALTNVLKHSGARRVEVTVDSASDGLAIEVRDDGAASTSTGAAPDDGTGGHGLIGMRERVRLYGGTLETGAVAPRGFRVRAHLPAGGAP